MAMADHESPEEMTLFVDAEKCTGCNSCMLACSFAHDKVFSYERSRIRIWRDDSRGVFVPILCDQCTDAPCVLVCPTAALSQDAGGVVQYDPTRCVGCGECVNACPIGAISLGTDGKLLKCDRCSSLEAIPYCVQVCTAGALQWVPRKMTARLRAKKGAQRRLESMKSEGGM